MDILGHDVLRWLHVLAMTYWLGGEWGVFNASRQLAKPGLSLDERRRHMETAYRIDILARTGIILLLPLGLNMGYNLGAFSVDASWIVVMWILFGAWLSLTWAAYFTRDTDLGLRLTKADEAIRYFVIPALLVLGIWSLVGDGPFAYDWYAAKVTLFGLLLIIGLILRVIMRRWVIVFRRLDSEGNTPELQNELSSTLRLGMNCA
ncbi:MAG: hypothetical protein D6763_00225, partial [Alphaproteobacteria bacterium]